jgi:hypothetical protein
MVYEQMTLFLRCFNCLDMETEATKSVQVSVEVHEANVHWMHLWVLWVLWVAIGHHAGAMGCYGAPCWCYGLLWGTLGCYGVLWGAMRHPLGAMGCYVASTSTI